MKKICLMLVLALTMMCMHSVIAGADDGHYATGVNSYTNSASDGARTVLIYKGGINDAVTPENIYYVNQTYSEYGFSNLEMMMKRDVPAGTYTIITGEGGKIATFDISKVQATIVGYEEMKYLGENMNDEDSTYSVAFGISTKSMVTETSTLSMLFGDNLYTTDLLGENSIIEWKFGPLSYKDTQGAERTMFAIQLDGVDKEYVSVDENGNVTPNFSLYFKN